MEVYREIINGNKLAEVIDLSKILRESELEVIILPLKNKNKKKISLKDIPKHNMGKILTELDRNSIYLDDR